MDHLAGPNPSRWRDRLIITASLVSMMNQPQLLKCPACGANLSASSRHCEYCGAVLSFLPGSSQDSPDSRPVDPKWAPVARQREMSDEERYRVGRRLAVIGFVMAGISLLAMLSGIGPKAGLVCLCISTPFIVIGGCLQLDNAP